MQEFCYLFLMEHFKEFYVSTLRTDVSPSWTSKLMLEWILNVLGKCFSILSLQNKTPVY